MFTPRCNNAALTDYLMGHVSLKSNKINKPLKTSHSLFNLKEKSAVKILRITFHYKLLWVYFALIGGR